MGCQPPTLLKGLHIFSILPSCLLNHVLSTPSLTPQDLSYLLQASLRYPLLHSHIFHSANQASRIRLLSSSLGSLILQTKLPHESYLSLFHFLHRLQTSGAASPKWQTSLWSCGRNDAGQGARSSSTDRNQIVATVRVASQGGGYSGPPEQIVYVAAGHHHSACVTAGGELQVAGANRRGQLGVGDCLGRAGWTVVDRLKGGRICQLSCGGLHTVLLNEGGGVLVSGSNDYGQLGNGKVGGSVCTFEGVKGFEGGVVMVAAGRGHTVILREDGRVFGAGNNSCGQLGGRMGGVRTVFGEVGCFERRVVRVACGSDTTMMLTVDNMVLVTGKRRCGLSVIGGLGMSRVTHLSVGEGFAVARTGDCDVAVSVHRKRFYVTEELGGVRANCVSAGISHYAIVTEGGGVFSGGANAFGQVGAGEMGLTIEGGENARIIRPHRIPLTPVQIPPGYRALQVAAGAFHTLFLLEEIGV